MEDRKMLDYIAEVLRTMPSDWLRLTTHRLDIYNERLAKTEFLDHFEALFNDNNLELSSLKNLPTAYDYVRLGHPLSCILEWTIARINGSEAQNVLSFSSTSIPLLAILRKNSLDSRHTKIAYTGDPLQHLDIEVLKEVYGYEFDLTKVDSIDECNSLDASDQASIVFLSQSDQIGQFDIRPFIDFYVNVDARIGSVLLVNGEANYAYVSEIQHVRRRETISMTPADCNSALKLIVDNSAILSPNYDTEEQKLRVIDSLADITGAATSALLASSGLSIQYAIMMGLVHEAMNNHEGKAIKFVVPPNCYGGTNDQARRVAACIDNVEIVDLPVDGDNDMVQNITKVLDEIAHNDAIPYIIAEIPTNPRVEVPDLDGLRATLSKHRKTADGRKACDPVFILDQTFCPNMRFIAEGGPLATVKTISYSSGSKFASGGLCNAGYCVGNKNTEALIEKIQLHLRLCDNEATAQQVEVLARQLPSMKSRITQAYANTRSFVNFIKECLPEAKINFVSEELARAGFTPSVFSLDLPTKGSTNEERETYKRALNHKLIKMMITAIPEESKHCVSYGQLQGCYWTIPATSTQGTTKEGDKDYIARVALSPNLDLELHKQVFLRFVDSL